MYPRLAIFITKNKETPIFLVLHILQYIALNILEVMKETR